MATSTRDAGRPDGGLDGGEVTPLRSVGQRRETLGDLAYKELLDAILLYRLPPGTPLGLDQLARQLGMSRTPVNLALSRLHAEGLVSYNEHLGFVVRVLTAKDLREIFDLRLMCEMHAVATGLPGAPESHLAEIAAIQDKIASSTDWADPVAFRRFWELDGRFHHHIVRLSPNDQLQEWFSRLNHHVHGVRLALRSPQAAPFAAMLREHAAIVRTLRRRDVPAAQEALRRHIERSRDVSLERLAATERADGHQA
ncbi:MAG TPA: GntR family transcriptional regulator [Chloroflexota bacterium]|nr:GntR family transcriptional regulator [Chloroflexota bacterium]